MFHCVYIHIYFLFTIIRLYIMYIRIVLCCVVFHSLMWLFVQLQYIYIYIALVVFPYFVIIFFLKTLKKNYYSELSSRSDYGRQGRSLCRVH